MKKSLKKTTLTAIFALSALAASADDWYLSESVLQGTETWDWSNGENWGQSSSTAKPSADTNLWIIGETNGKNKSTLSSGFTANELKFTNSGNMDINWASYDSGSGNANITLNKLTFDNTGSLNSTYIKLSTTKTRETGETTVDKDGKTVNITKTVNQTLTINGDINVIAGTEAAQTIDMYSNGGKYAFHVKGDLNITNKKATDNFIWTGETVIDGVINMKSADAEKSGAKLQLQLWNQTIGGLSDCGEKNVHVISTQWGGGVTFKNKTNQTWSGTIVNKKMELRYAGTAMQRLEVVSGEFDNVRISNGRLELAMSSSAVNGNFSISGGVFDNDGEINFVDASFGGGKVNFDNAADKINVLGTAMKNASGNLEIDFNGLVIEADKVYEIISAALVDSSFKSDASDIIGSGYDSDKFLLNFAWAGTTLTATFTSTVPEPATVAAILGAIALAFAAYRRRK